jgi:ATP-dependent RNA helicase DeaD
MGFLEDIEYVMSHLPAERVTALFSATMPDAITRLARSYMRDPQLIQLSRPRELTVAKVEQTYIQVPGNRKFDALCRVLDVERPDRALIFCGTKRMVDEVVDRVVARGYEAEGLHGDMSQATREKVLRAFRDGRLEVLVATDVAARGLDVPSITHVLNFDIPPDPEYYVHRIGRTARSGQAGEAITFVTPWEMRQLKAIERVTGAHIRRAEVPTAAEAEARQVQALQERLLETLQAGQWGAYRAVVEELFDDHDPVDLAAAALSLAAGRMGRDGGDLGALAAQREAEQAAPPPSEPKPGLVKPRRDEQWVRREESGSRDERRPSPAKRGPARSGRGKPPAFAGRRPKGAPASRTRRPGGKAPGRDARR